MLALEFRNIAQNQLQLEKLSPLDEVNEMLKTDIIVKRKNYEAFSKTESSL